MVNSEDLSSKVAVNEAAFTQGKHRRGGIGKNKFPAENRSPVCQPVAVLCTGHTFVFLAFSLPKEEE